MRELVVVVGIYYENFGYLVLVCGLMKKYLNDVQIKGMPYTDRVLCRTDRNIFK